jgi:hypothetical protein
MVVEYHRLSSLFYHGVKIETENKLVLLFIMRAAVILPCVAFAQVSLAQLPFHRCMECALSSIYA